jgi:hypothetical protein
MTQQAKAWKPTAEDQLNELIGRLHDVGVEMNWTNDEGKLDYTLHNTFVVPSALVETDKLPTAPTCQYVHRSLDGKHPVVCGLPKSDVIAHNVFRYANAHHFVAPPTSQEKEKSDNMPNPDELRYMATQLLRFNCTSMLPYSGVAEHDALPEVITLRKLRDLR